MSHAIPAVVSSATPEEPPAPRPRRRWKLQTRLMVTVLGIVSVLLIAVAAATTSVLFGTLNSQLDDNVRSAAQKASMGINGALRDGYRTAEDVLGNMQTTPGQLLVLEITGGDTSAAYFNTEGTIVTINSDDLAKLIDEAEPKQDTGPGAGPVYTLHVPDAGAYRAVLLSGQGVNAIIGLPVAAYVDAPLTKLLWAIGLVTVAGLLVLALATILVIRSGLRPLREVVSTAEHVAALRLDKGEVAITDRVADDAVDDHTEIGRVGAALNTMLDHVDESLQARARNEELMRRFVADASHELRTPLASIRGYSELSLRASDNPETTTTALERIQAQSLRMTRLVEDLLLLARLDEGQEIVVGDVDLTPLVIDALSDARAAGPEHEWKIDVTGESLLVAGDAGRLNQVVTNLLANARTHTPAGTTVTLALRHEPGFAVIDVHDDGPGIDPSVRDELFDRFARADKSRARKTGGTGLGLSIAKAIADAHYGSLSVQSVPGDTTFTFRLPLAAVTGTSVAPPAV